MTPKEKAKELVEKFKNRSIELGETHSQLMAEANALITVDEIILTCAFNDYKTKKYFEHCNDYDDSYFMTYWQEVKTEIQKL